MGSIESTSNHSKSRRHKDIDEEKIKLAVENTNGGFQAVNSNCQMGIQSGLLEIGKRYLKEMERKEEEGDGEDVSGGINMK